MESGNGFDWTWKGSRVQGAWSILVGVENFRPKAGCGSVVTVNRKFPAVGLEIGCSRCRKQSFWAGAVCVVGILLSMTVYVWRALGSLIEGSGAFAECQGFRE